ncbi:uncharacterized protein LOC116336917 [Contarinia nasturtii]|uniref:uncharacterized protein LOC116336917 n=1 Tax=Contarinia nasturtii TaxID=265458 RepID=UPI0012D3B25C|nr:uncharacterized protein LOC116336917 [Contarinia nasturtii]
MSIPQLFLTAPSPSASSIALPNGSSTKFQSPDVSATSKENIRERLNMHVKKRIQGHDVIAQYSLPPPPIPQATSPFYSNPMSSTTLKPNHHPFLISGAPMPPVVVFANSLISVASNIGGRTIPIPQIDRQPSKLKQPKKMTKKKKTGGNKKKPMQIDANQQAENLILNTKFSDDSNEFHDKNHDHLLFNGCPSPQISAISPTDSYDNKLSNAPDILSMVLSLKKNALMHDPYVIQFLSTIR